MCAKILLAFDLYGTLLSTESIQSHLQIHFEPEIARAISEKWRRFQLEYTWRLNSMSRYEDFTEVTRNSLLHALAENGQSLDDASISQLMMAYDNLSAFPDVAPALDKLSQESLFKPVIFSNGSNVMVSNSVNRCLSQHASIFHGLLTADDIQRYKPSRLFYQRLAEQFGKGLANEDIWIISANPFDIVGSRNMGMRAVWVDRAGSGWKDAVIPDLKPTLVVHSLQDVTDKIQAYIK
ncbi:hypothetical protein DTO006G1_7910 [Penicillium roqueforti]|nr:hypothetical protein CBS147337_8089 [Penicillium roqueforti]KAI2674125.1 hypothetical protein CBS147355_7300 [Penicillium roqueforti]KAI2725053.1 hypothetical protein CBS147354_5370 [Penicillium roqueforti]KAI2756546.1 hypothetical protein DTO006G1_7910 [Penicillium roqueforti]KAI3126571.1 hypothetical protein CBS147330_6359 [Penicillium roqueforti]